MDLVPNTWYPGALGGMPRDLHDGSTLLAGEHRFLGSRLSTLSGLLAPRRRREGEEPRPPERYLQVTLDAVDPSLIDDLPPISGISPRLLSEQLLQLRHCTFAYDLLLRRAKRELLSPGAVCIRLLLAAPEARSADLVRRSRNVEEAFRSGVLDRTTRAKADFRLDIKPLTRRLQALIDSAYLPDDAIAIEVLFAHWYALPDYRPVAAPLDGMLDATAALAEWEVQLRPTGLERAMRVADLFAGGG